VNYKRKSRHQFFLLVRLRSPPVSSEFRGGVEHPPPLRDPPGLKGFENWVLKNILGSKRENVSGDWRKLHESFRDLYFPPNITCIRVIWWRRMRWLRHVAYTEGRELHAEFWWEKSEGTWQPGSSRNRLGGCGQWWALVNMVVNHNVQ